MQAISKLVDFAFKISLIVIGLVVVLFIWLMGYSSKNSTDENAVVTEFGEMEEGGYYLESQVPTALREKCVAAAEAAGYPEGSSATLPKATPTGYYDENGDAVYTYTFYAEVDSQTDLFYCDISDNTENPNLLYLENGNTEQLIAGDKNYARYTASGELI